MDQQYFRYLVLHLLVKVQRHLQERVHRRRLEGTVKSKLDFNARVKENDDREGLIPIYFQKTW